MKKYFIIFIGLLTSNAFAVITDNVINGCGNPTLYIKNNYAKNIAVFKPNEYTCSSGYFLPANTDGCQPCPNGYTCDGGTFTSNETIAQGISGNPIINQNISNLCSKNKLPTTQNNRSVLTAKFAPNTITLNFDDNNGNTTQTSCTYNNSINLPPEPTRQGYNFVGWKIRTNND